MSGEICYPSEVAQAIGAIVRAARRIAEGEKWGFAIGPAPLDAYHELDAALASLDALNVGEAIPSAPSTSSTERATASGGDAND